MCQKTPEETEEKVIEDFENGREKARGEKL